MVPCGAKLDDTRHHFGACRLQADWPIQAKRVPRACGQWVALRWGVEAEAEGEGMAIESCSEQLRSAGVIAQRVALFDVPTAIDQSVADGCVCSILQQCRGYVTPGLARMM